MNIFMQIIFDLFVNCFEAFLIYLLLSRHLHFRKNLLLTIVCFGFQILSVTTMNQCISIDSVRMIITLLIDVGIAILLSIDILREKIFWGCVYPIITVIADTIIVLLGNIFIRDSCIVLIEYPFDIIMTLFYLLICFWCVLFLNKKKRTNFILPWIFPSAWIFTIIIGIAAIEFLLDSCIQLNQTPLGKRLFVATILLVLILFLSILLFYYIGLLYQKNIELHEDNRQKELEKQQFELLEHTNQLLRTWKHDLHHHLSALQILLQEEHYEVAERYLNEFYKEMDQSTRQIQTGNSILDAILNSKLSKIQTEQICFSHNIFIPALLPIKDLQLTSLMGNLLDNAIEACEQISVNERFITLNIKPYKQFLSIEILNSFDRKTNTNHFNQLISTKTVPGHGIGLKRVKEIAEEAGGFMNYSIKNNIFSIIILLPLSSTA